MLSQSGFSSGFAERIGEQAKENRGFMPMNDCSPAGWADCLAERVRNLT